MFKYLINLLTTATSLIVALLVTNLSIAAPPTSDLSTENVTTLRLPISLNSVSPELQLASARQTTQFPHLGCSCPDCTQVVESQSKL
ncbi:hypothetical protein [Myxosarcina sp. GI1(2024)]